MTNKLASQRQKIVNIFVLFKYKMYLKIKFLFVKQIKNRDLDTNM